MRYRLLPAIACGLIGLFTGGLTLVLQATLAHWTPPFRPSWLGLAIFAAYGGSIGGVVGFVTGLLARPAAGDKRFPWILYAVVVLACLGAAIGCLPFTIPDELFDLLTDP